jgi:DNA-binding NtrC family response regulator
MTKPSLLLVDDDRHVLDAMADWLRSLGYELDATAGYVDALERLRQKTYDLVLADIRMADGDGFDLLEQCRRNWPAAQVILITGYGTADSAIEAIRAGAFDYLTKPLIDNELQMAIERALSQRNVLRENDNLRAQLDRRYGMDNIVGRDPRMIKVFDMIASVADTRATVLVTGESGTGKSMIARAIHRRSGRAKGPFVEVACGALPETLLESELFGHERGAFTGAGTTRIGKFEFAQHGTIMLDEIGEMPAALQAKILHVLQDRQFTRLGSNRPIDADVRVLAATNRNLEAMMRAGGFREDLYYRLQVIELRVPALRDRREEIPALVEFFLAKYARVYRRPLLRPTQVLLDTIKAYSWPGNIRELENMMKRLVVLQDEALVLSELAHAKDAHAKEMLAAGVQAQPAPAAVTPTEAPAPAPPPVEIPAEVAAADDTDEEPGEGEVAAGGAGDTIDLQSLARTAAMRAEREAIQQALARFRWNRRKTAEYLSVSYKTLLNKIKECGITDSRAL